MLVGSAAKCLGPKLVQGLIGRPRSGGSHQAVLILGRSILVDLSVGVHRGNQSTRMDL